MGAPRACLIFITIHLVSLAYAQDLSKRMPQGFLGMRGKKYFDDEGVEQFYKRKPQFFVGVKGKKSLQDILETPEEYYKQTYPIGFMGTRGKKAALFPEFESREMLPKRDGSLIGQIDYSNSNEKHNDPDLPLLDELLLQYLIKLQRPRTNLLPELDPENEQIADDVEKRAANIHQFFGVRGKKSMNNKRPYDLTFRGKFIGVRGKKDMKNAGPHEIKFLVDQNGLPKRKAQMGFFGMRGKKWTDESSSSEMESEN